MAKFEAYSWPACCWTNTGRRSRLRSGGSHNCGVSSAGSIPWAVRRPGPSGSRRRRYGPHSPTARAQTATGRRPQSVSSFTRLRSTQQHVGGPAEHGEHTASTGRSAFGRLAEAHRAHPVVAELGRHGIGTEVSRLEHADLSTSQSPRVGDLEHGGVAKGGRPALLGPAPDRHHVVVGRVEERLEFHPRQGTTGGPAPRTRWRGWPCSRAYRSGSAPCRTGSGTRAPSHRRGRTRSRRRRPPPSGSCGSSNGPDCHHAGHGSRPRGARAATARPHRRVQTEPAHDTLARNDGPLVQTARQLLVTPPLEHGLE